MTRTIRILLPALLLCAALANYTFAGPISVGNLVVVRVGTGSAAPAAIATDTFLEEYDAFTPSQAAPIQTITLQSTAAAGGNRALTLTGNATSEGFLKQSKNRAYLTLGGYNKTAGAAGSPATDTPATTNRVVGLVDISTGAVDTTTSLSDAYSGSNIRSAITTDGTNIWTGGNAGSGLGTTGGVRYLTYGSSSSLRVNDGAGSGSNSRVVNIGNDGQLYVSASSSPRLAIQQIGTGTPTTAGQSETTLPGMPTSGTHSAYDYWFKDLNTVYLADDGSAASGGGIQKWTFDGTNWALAYTLLNNGTTTTAVRGLSGTVDALGNAVLFATTTATSNNLLISVTDLGLASTATTLASAGTNRAFRGVVFVVPEPGSAVLILLVGVTFAGAARRR